MKLPGKSKKCNMNKIIENDIREIINNLNNERFSGKSILLTGAAGFLGTYFTHYFLILNDLGLLTKKCRIYCLDNFSRGVPDWLLGFKDRTDLVILEANIVECRDFPQSDFIIHAASIASPIYYRIHPIETMDANVIGFRNLLDFVRTQKCESFLYFSTSEIYGDPDENNIPTKETYRGNVSCNGPRACYDESKRYGETLAVNFWKQYGIPVKIARPFNNYGPGLKITDKRVIPDFFNNILEGNDIQILSDGRATRTFCYISDAITGYLKILLSDYNGEPFNIGTEEPEISMYQLAERIIFLFKLPNKIVFSQSSDVEYLTDNPQRRCPDITKAKSLLNYSPNISLDDGLMRIYEYYKDQRKSLL